MHIRNFRWLQLAGVVSFRTDYGDPAALAWNWFSPTKTLGYMLGVETPAGRKRWMWALGNLPEIDETHILVGLAAKMETEADVAAEIGNAGFELAELLQRSYQVAVRNGY